jgi:hypothetical protein
MYSLAGYPGFFMRLEAANLASVAERPSICAAYAKHGISGANR